MFPKGSRWGLGCASCGYYFVIYSLSRAGVFHLRYFQKDISVSHVGSRCVLLLLALGDCGQCGRKRDVGIGSCFGCTMRSWFQIVGGLRLLHGAVLRSVGTALVTSDDRNVSALSWRFHDLGSAASPNLAQHAPSEITTHSDSRSSSLGQCLQKMVHQQVDARMFSTMGAFSCCMCLMTARCRSATKHTPFVISRAGAPRRCVNLCRHGRWVYMCFVVGRSEFIFERCAQHWLAIFEI